MTRLLTFLAAAAAAHAATINVPADQATIQAGINAAGPGDTVLVAAGVYNENIRTAANGASGNRIIIDGQGVATVKQVTFAHSYNTVQGFTVKGRAQAYQAGVWFAPNGHYAILQDCVVDNELVRDMIGIGWTFGEGKPYSIAGDTASNCQILNNTVKNVGSTVMLLIAGDDNLIQGNTVKDGAEVDFIRLFGRRNIFLRNTFTNNYQHPDHGNHADFIQCFGNDALGSEDHIIDGNVINGVENGGLSQLEGNLVDAIGGWTFRNNIFLNISNTASCSIPNIKYYNNLFYKCNYGTGGHPLTFGLRSYEITTVSPDNPNYALLGIKASGDLVEGGVYVPYLINEIASGNIAEGVGYVVASASNSATVTYNGTVYRNRDQFTGAAGVTTFTRTSTVAKVHVYGTVTYDGVEYGNAAAFTAGPDLTYTTSIPDIVVHRRMYNRGDGATVRGNVFFDCGDSRASRGWYSIDTGLTGVSADYNYVAKEGFAPVIVDSLQRDIGNPGGWDTQNAKWWEDNGVNGGDPSFTDFSTYNFALLAGSILIDASETIAAVTTDLNGVARPQAAGYDIGPYEFDSGGTPPDPPIPNDPPLAPDTLAAATADASTITLTWNDNAANETGFNIARSTDQVSWFDLPNAAASAEFAAISGLAASTTYYFRVRAFNSGGFSAWSNVSEATTAAPVIQSGDKWVTWDDDINPAGTINFYNVYLRDVGAGPDFTLNGTSTGLTYFFDDLPVGSYECKVKSSRAGVESAFSNTYAFVIGNPPASVERRGNPRKGGPMAASIPP